MIMNLTRRRRVPRNTLPAAMDEHYAIRTIGRLLVISITALVLTATVLLLTVTQLRSALWEKTGEAERVRAANAIDLVSQNGPLTPEGVEMIARVAGLTDARLLTSPPLDTDREVMPLLGPQGLSGSYLAWRTDPLAGDLFLQFAPVRIPIALTMVFAVIVLLLRLRFLVSDIELQRRSAHALSRTDTVTGLANRLAFEMAMQEHAARGTAFGVIVLDLDHFKAVNDALGHAAGDTVLRTVGQRLTDLLGAGDHLSRLGGDEFVILSTSKSGHAALSVLAQQCIIAIERPIELAGQAVRVGASLGLVQAGGDTLPPATLLGAADAALYRAKSTAGSSFQFAGEVGPDADLWQLRTA